MTKELITRISANRKHLMDSAFKNSCALVVIALPFSIGLTSKAILLLVVIWIFRTGITGISKAFRNRLALLFISPYVLLVLSLLYTSSLKSGLWELEKATPLLLFPILFCSSPTMSTKDVQFILRAFVLANLAFGVIVIAHSGYKYFANGVNHFHNFDLVDLFRSHPTYYSMYILFSLSSLFYLRSYAVKPTILEKSRLAAFMIVLFFSILIFLLSVRSIFIIYIITTLVWIVIYVYRTRRIIVGLLLIAVLSLVVVMAVSTNNVLRDRLMQLKENYTYELSPEHMEGYNGFTTRLAQWESSFPIIKNNLIFGVGPADVQDSLQVAYQKNFLKYSFRDRLNAHNQYMQTTLGLGLIGLVAFLGTLIVPGLIAYRQKNLLAFMFIILFSICCVTESMLYVQKGLVFFGFFNALFTFHMLMNGPRTCRA